MQGRTAAILPFLLRMLLPGILSSHDNQASISDPDLHFVRHFALKRRFRSEMDFSRPVASATNRAPIPASYRLRELGNCKENTTRQREYGGTLSRVDETRVQIFVTTFASNSIKTTAIPQLFKFFPVNYEIQSDNNVI